MKSIRECREKYHYEDIFNSPSLQMEQDKRKRRRLCICVREKKEQILANKILSDNVSLLHILH